MLLLALLYAAQSCLYEHLLFGFSKREILYPSLEDLLTVVDNIENKSLSYFFISKPRNELSREQYKLFSIVQKAIEEDLLAALQDSKSEQQILPIVYKYQKKMHKFLKALLVLVYLTLEQLAQLRLLLLVTFINQLKQCYLYLVESQFIFFTNYSKNRHQRNIDNIF